MLPGLGLNGGILFMGKDKGCLWIKLSNGELIFCSTKKKHLFLFKNQQN